MEKRVQKVLELLPDDYLEAILIKDLWAENKALKAHLEFLNEAISIALSKKWEEQV